MTCHDHRLLLCPSPQASLPAETLGDDLHGVVDQRYSRLNSKLNSVPMVQLCTNARGEKSTRRPDPSNSEFILPRWIPKSFEERQICAMHHADCCKGDDQVDAKALRGFDTKLL